VIVLGIHSSGPQPAVAVAAGAVLLAETILPPARTHLERLGPAIQETLRALGMEASDVDAVAVALGPGSFSGIRVGLATAKGIAAALDKPIVGVSSLEIIARRALMAGETGIPVIDARRGEIYAAAYRYESRGMTRLSEAFLLTASSLPRFAESIEGASVLCGDASVVEPSSFPKRVCFRQLLGPSASWVARVGAQRVESGRADDLTALTPLYVRRSDAEEKRLRSRGPEASSLSGPTGHGTR
jgi:tRNA threonylcarbamoyladenosine biosynthesis protein TsaB